MKSVLAICGIVAALFAAPAFADTLTITNQGLVSGIGDGGITALSVVNGISFDGFPLSTGPSGSIFFNFGLSTGSLLSGGQFTNGELDLALNIFPATIFISDFTGGWTNSSDNMYELFGTFSAGNGSLHGVSTQFFKVEFEDGQACLRDVGGTTTITTVPEPGTLTLLGSGLVGLAGAARRKLRAEKASQS